MLKNKEERKAYLLNEDNWETVYSHPSIFTTIKQMVLPDGTIVIREDVLEKDEYQRSVIQYSKSHLVTQYRIVRSTYVTCSLCMSVLVDIVGRV